MKRANRPGGQSANGPIVRRAFLRHVHELLLLGYRRLAPARFTNAQEEVITGVLVRGIDEVLDDPPLEVARWAGQFSVHEEPRINAPRRRGRKRLRLDIRIDSSLYTPRTRFKVEAKRLSRNHRVSGYLGQGGLGAYLSGEYAREDNVAGMLGYVQRRNEEDWAADIGAELDNNPAHYRCVSNPRFQRVEIVSGLDCTFVSDHTRERNLPRIRVYHMLLLFR